MKSKKLLEKILRTLLRIEENVSGSEENKDMCLSERVHDLENNAIEQNKRIDKMLDLLNEVCKQKSDDQKICSS